MHLNRQDQSEDVWSQCTVPDKAYYDLIGEWSYEHQQESKKKSNKKKKTPQNINNLIKSTIRRIWVELRCYYSPQFRPQLLSSWQVSMNKCLQTSINWSDCIEEQNCSTSMWKVMRGYKLLNHWMSLVFHTLLMHFVFVK